MAESPWGWYVPMTSPTTLAHLECGRSGRCPLSNMEYRIRRCTGLSPSRTSGSARATMTDMEYSRNERSISSWISMGSMDPPAGGSSPPGGAGGGALPAPPPALTRPFPRVDCRGISTYFRSGSSDVEEPHVLGVRLDEVAAQLDVVTHQDGADLVGQRGLFHVDLQQRALRRIHRRVAQLGEVHLAQALEPVEVVLVVGVLGQERRLRRVVLEIDLLLADQRRVQRRLRHVHEPTLDERFHLAEEEGEQQRADVAAVDVGIGQQDHLVVADLLDVELLGQPRADGRDERLDLCVLQHLVDARALDVENLAADRQDRLRHGVARVLG